MTDSYFYLTKLSEVIEVIEVIASLVVNGITLC